MSNNNKKPSSKPLPANNKKKQPQNPPGTGRRSKRRGQNSGKSPIVGVESMTGLDQRFAEGFAKRVAKRGEGMFKNYPMSKMDLSPCAMEYAMSLANPFTGPEDACIPDFPPLITGRQRVFIRGTFTTSTVAGAQGFGFIVFSPERCAVNDQYCVETSAATYATNTIDVGNAAGTSVYTSNSQYPTASIGQGQVTFRVVSAGMRIMYAGSFLQQGGQYIGLHHPTHANLDTNNVAQLEAYEECGNLPVSNAWTTLIYRPVETVDLDFETAILPATAANTFYMAFAVQAPDSTGANPVQTRFECYANIEYIGFQVRNKKPSHTDTVGHGAVTAISNMVPALKRPHTVGSETMAHATKEASNTYAKKNTTHGGSKDGKDAIDVFLDVIGTGASIANAIGSFF